MQSVIHVDSLYPRVTSEKKSQLCLVLGVKGGLGLGLGWGGGGVGSIIICDTAVKEPRGPPERGLIN